LICELLRRVEQATVGGRRIEFVSQLGVNVSCDEQNRGHGKQAFGSHIFLLGVYQSGKRLTPSAGLVTVSEEKRTI
jgi:hypothetical protein